ncbi:MAG: hypothetical protein J6866_03230, partial [Victivallales bacterium]|nr:hypothetical protein [Victivallales bacterium]
QTGDVRQSTLRYAMWWLVRHATRGQQEQPINKSNILSEHGQHYIPSGEKERRQRTAIPVHLFNHAAIFVILANL